MELIVSTFIVPMIAIAWICILTSPGYPFSFVGRLLIKAPQWVRDPLVDCHICCAGQIGLWFYLLWQGLDFLIIPYVLTIIYLTSIYPKPNE